jgi:predicted permease
MGLWSRLTRTFRADRRDRHAAEIDEEIQFHLAMKARDGHTARETRLRFGPADAIRQETRAAGIVQGLESLLQDARYGLRQLRQTPALTLAIVLSLTIGIGANTAIFGLVDAALIKGLPVPDPGALAVVQWASPDWPKPLVTGHTGTTDDDATGRILAASSFGPRLYRTLAREQSAVAALIGFSDPDGAGLVAKGHPAESVGVQYVSDNFFQGLGVTLVAGRPFLPEDDRAGIEPVVIISHRLWQRLFGEEAAAIDQPLRINGTVARVIGVAPPGFFGNHVGGWTDLYVPLAARAALGSGVGARNRADVIEADGYWWVRVMARLKPGADAAASREQLTSLYRRLVVPEGVTMAPARIPTLLFQPGSRGYDAKGGEEARALWILLLLVALVLLIVCVNVANLLLSRAVARQREAAVRLALGAGRWRLLRQQLVESLVLALIGGAIGLAFGALLAEAIHAVFRAGDNLGGYDLHVSGRLIAFTAGVSMLTALIFGCAPALRMARADFNTSLKANNRSVFAGRLRLPRALVVVQIALCLTVLVAAGLLGRSLAKLKGLDLGFNRERIVYVTVNPWRAGYHAAQVGPYADRLRDGLAAVPGVTHAAIIALRPLSGPATSTRGHIPGRDVASTPPVGVLVHRVGDGLIETLGLTLLTGRTLDARDMRTGSEAMVIDDLFAQRMFPNQNPIGRRVSFGQHDDNLHEVVGVVSSSRYNSLRRDRAPVVYWPWLPGESSGWDIHVALRTAIEPRGLYDSIRHAVAAVDANVPLEQMQTQTALIDELLHTERLLGILSNAFGIIALLLAGVGLAGLLVYSVTRRTNEIGIRIALGAAPGQVAAMVLGDSLWLVATGILVGLPCAYAVARLLGGMLFDLQPADPATAAISLSLLATVAALAAWLPARRAARIDPIAALREE